ncbi:MAG: hypothetical protein Q8878_06380 [Bacillota bacterium]|nr:hypothetical protein [Bacillota bacterium]
MAETKRKASSDSGYKIRNLFPGKEFSKADQQRIAAQISSQLNLHKELKLTDNR